MKTQALALSCALLLSNLALASPAGFTEIEELRTHQQEVIVDMENKLQRQELSTEELLLEVEAMMKLYSRLNDATTSSSNRGTPNPERRFSELAASSSHLNYLKSWQARCHHILGYPLN